MTSCVKSHPSRWHSLRGLRCWELCDQHTACQLIPCHIIKRQEIPCVQGGVSNTIILFFIFERYKEENIQGEIKVRESTVAPLIFPYQEVRSSCRRQHGGWNYNGPDITFLYIQFQSGKLKWIQLFPEQPQLSEHWPLVPWVFAGEGFYLYMYKNVMSGPSYETEVHVYQVCMLLSATGRSYLLVRENEWCYNIKYCYKNVIQPYVTDITRMFIHGLGL